MYHWRWGYKIDLQPVFTFSKLTIETLVQGLKYGKSGVFIVNFEHISHLALVFLLLNLSKKMPTGFMLFYLEKKIWMSSLQSLDKKELFH